MQLSKLGQEQEAVVGQSELARELEGLVVEQSELEQEIELEEMVEMQH
jgi:hypothetical protein